MMDFFTHFLKSRQIKLAKVLMCGFAAYLFSAISLNHYTYAVSSENTAVTSIGSTQVERVDNVIYLNAQLNFELPVIVEDVLLKGIPLIFVVEADLKRERWYWYDKKITVTTRQMRLAYQPLTRRWRLNVNNGSTNALNSGGLGGGLPQYFDTLSEAISNLQRIRRWRVLEASDIESDTPYTIDLVFKLDISQLPRPFQIGLIGQSDWNISASKTIRFTAEALK